MKILFIFGTRPEAIKMAPLIRYLKEELPQVDSRVCITAQHREMLDQVLSFFSIKPDYDLNLMGKNQTLFDITAKGIALLEPVFKDFSPDYIIVQGDTTTTFIGALSAYYGNAKVVHIEAGLRSGDKQSPFPEEVNRILTAKLADYHFAPTQAAYNNLLKEGHDKNLWIVGNTVIDALHNCLSIIQEQGVDRYWKKYHFLTQESRKVLVTAHRRENFGEPFNNVAYAIRDLARKFPDIQIVYPVHLNPNVRKPAFDILGNESNVFLQEPLDYPDLVWMMSISTLVISDSGGIQEEAPALGKPVLVTREVTERIEGVQAGTARLVGTDRQKIVEMATTLLTDQAAYDSMANAVNPYGDGTTSQQIANHLNLLQQVG